MCLESTVGTICVVWHGTYAEKYVCISGADLDELCSRSLPVYLNDSSWFLPVSWTEAALYLGNQQSLSVLFVCIAHKRDVYNIAWLSSAPEYNCTPTAHALRLTESDWRRRESASDLRCRDIHHNIRHTLSRCDGLVVHVTPALDREEGWFDPQGTRSVFFCGGYKFPHWTIHYNQYVYCVQNGIYILQ